MINRVLITLAILLIPDFIFGQVDFYMDLSGSYSFIPKKEFVDDFNITDTYGNPYTLKYTEEYKVKPGLSVEAGFNKTLNHRFSINSGIGISLFQFKRESTVRFIEQEESGANGSIGQSGSIGDDYVFQPGEIKYQYIDDLPNETPVMVNSKVGKTKILYLAIPIRFQYAIVPERLKIGLGLINYFVAYSSQIKTTMDFDTVPISEIEYDDKTSNGFNNYLLAGDITVEGKILKGLWIKTGFTNSFSSIFDKPQTFDYPSTINHDAKYRTVSIGLKYIIQKTPSTIE
ncbi:MAG: hypothetical protein HC819_21410 [Cyclobacteriaceae bacterium]|nr:hypothetical protein [Cyclobacteriaceae bacterium]